MKTLVTVMTAAALTLGVVGTSQAADEVVFKDDAKASVAEVYTDLNRQAKKICKTEMGAFRQYGIQRCVDDYVGQIVSKINRLELTAYHNRMTSTGDIIELAQLDK